MKKKYLTFDELCQRWNCSKSELHYFVLDRVARPSIVWLDQVKICWWEPASENNCLYLVSKLDDDLKRQYSSKRAWVHLRDVRPTGAWRYEFTYASKELFQPLKEFDGEWYEFYHYESGQYWEATIDQDFIEKNAVFFIEAIEMAECLDFDSMPPKLEIDDPLARIDKKELLNEQKVLSSKERNSLLNIIAGLHQTLLEFPATETQKPIFKSQNDLISYLESYKGYQGLSKSNLEKVFPEARKSMGLHPLK